MDARKNLLAFAQDRDLSLASLSRVIGRNSAYLHQYVAKGTPRRLPEEDRRRLAIFLNVDERKLGARDPWEPIHAQAGPSA